jgi:hypothetical protein
MFSHVCSYIFKRLNAIHFSDKLTEDRINAENVKQENAMGHIADPTNTLLENVGD